MKNNLKINGLAVLHENPYPFTCKGFKKNGNPVLWGDFSNGMCGFYGYAEKEVLWDKIEGVYDEELKKYVSVNNIKRTPPQINNEINSNSLIDPQNISSPMNTMNPLSPLNIF